VNRNLIVDAKLTEPPSEVSVFRDISLYASSFLNLSVLVQCNRQDFDVYWYWLRKNGAFDYVRDLIEPETDDGILISCLRGHIAVENLKAETLNFVIHQLIKIAK
tara:strand:- start:4887 stop:5201 length:315 start_codon:yes stop_codon:yes gene_type:complete